jgi:hypothetical protein
MGFLDFLFGKKKDDEPQVAKQSAKPTQSRSMSSHTTSNSSQNPSFSKMKGLVDLCLKLETKGNVSELQNTLYQLYSMLNKPGAGRLILEYKEKDNLALCFAFMLFYDWMDDSDIREVWAEDGFYCIQEHLDNQSNGMQGQVEAMVILFTLLCVGRDSLKPKFQDIINKSKYSPNRSIFHADDYSIGAQNVIDQISLLAVSGIRPAGQNAIPMMSAIVQKYNGVEFFNKTIQRRDLMKYDPTDIIAKCRLYKQVIGSILLEM